MNNTQLADVNETISLLKIERQAWTRRGSDEVLYEKLHEEMQIIRDAQARIDLAVVQYLTSEAELRRIDLRTRTLRKRKNDEVLQPKAERLVELLEMAAKLQAELAIDKQ